MNRQVNITVANTVPELTNALRIAIEVACRSLITKQERQDLLINLSDLLKVEFQKTEVPDVPDVTYSRGWRDRHRQWPRVPNNRLADRHKHPRPDTDD